MNEILKITYYILEQNQVGIDLTMSDSTLKVVCDCPLNILMSKGCQKKGEHE